MFHHAIKSKTISQQMSSESELTANFQSIF